MKMLKRSAVRAGMSCGLVIGLLAGTVSHAAEPTQGSDAWDGHSVELGTGVFVHRVSDLYLETGIPLALTRSYRSGDPAVRQFGIGAGHAYLMSLSASPPYQEAFVVLGDGTRVRYGRTSPGTGVDGAVFAHVDSPSAHHGSTLRTGNWALPWQLTMTDGTVYMFHANTPLQRIEDPYNRVVGLARSGGSVTGPIASVSTFTTGLGVLDRRISFGYDAVGRIAQARDSLGRIVGYAYDAAGRLASVADPDGGVTQYSYDGQHRMLTIRDPRGVVVLTNEYDAAGRVIRQVLADQAEYRYAYTLDSGGKVVRTDVTNPRGVVRRVAFDARGYRVSDTRAHGTPIAQTTTFERDTSGVVLAVTDALGRRTAFTRDASGNVTSVARLAGSAQAATTTFGYTPAGDAGIRRLVSIADPLGQTTSFAYDAAGYPIAITDALGSRIQLSRTFDGSLAGLGDPLGGVTKFERDIGDNVVRIIDPLGRATIHARDSTGRLLTETDAAGRITAYAYDRRDRVTQITDAAGGVTRFQYDANGNVVAATDARGKTTRFAYDGRNRLISRTDPLQRSDTYAYDANGNPTSVTDRKGQVTTIAHDALDRPVTITYADGATVGYVWDGGNRLVELTDASGGGVARTWDGLDRLASETTALGTVVYAYDASGRRTSMTVQGQPAVAYQYDVASQLSGISRGGAVAAAVYDAAGRRTSITWPNGVVATLAYDAASQLTGLTYRRGAAVLGTLAYGYDAAGTRVRAGGTWARTMLPQAVPSASYDDANRPLVFGGAVLTHDANGNLTGDGTSLFTWNARNQLVGVDGGELTARFAYDALGRRDARAIGAATTELVYDGLTAVEEIGSAGHASVLGGFELDHYLALGDGLVPLTDGLGSVIALADQTGAVSVEYTYEPFGALADGAPADPGAYRFTGREDDGTGLSFHRARYYHPTLQRFISEERSGFARGRMNGYVYAANSPIDTADPLGLGMDARRPRSFAALATSLWDPTRSAGMPSGVLRLPGLREADAALVGHLVAARVSPAVGRAVAAVRAHVAEARTESRPVCARPGSLTPAASSVEDAVSSLLALIPATPGACAGIRIAP